MKVRILNAEEISRLSSVELTLAALSDSFRAITAQQAVTPPRGEIILDPESVVFIMPGYLEPANVFGIKFALWRSSRATDGRVPPCLVTTFECDDSGSVGLLDGRVFTDIRTSMVSALAARLLANPQARKLAVIGAGRQAKSHVEALLDTTNVESVAIYSRTESSAHDLVANQAAQHHSTHFEVAATVQTAVSDADIVVTATTASSPVVELDDVKQGALVLAVGAFRPDEREIDITSDPELRVVVDSREACLVRAGEFVIPLGSGAVDPTWDVTAELGELLDHDTPLHDPHRKTLFKSVGVAANDIALGQAILKAAIEQGIGAEYDFG